MKAKDLGLILSVDQCIKIAEGTCEMQADNMKRLRSQQSKRAAKQSMEFFEAIAYHLKYLKEISTHLIKEDILNPQNDNKSKCEN